METYTPTVECCAGPFRRQVCVLPWRVLTMWCSFPSAVRLLACVINGLDCVSSTVRLLTCVTSKLDAFIDGTYVGLNMVNVLNLLIGSRSVGVYSQRVSIFLYQYVVLAAFVDSSSIGV